MQTQQTIPAPIKQAAVGMLVDYIPDLTPDILEARLMSSAQNAEDQAEELLERKEAKDRLRISLPTIDRMLATGQLTRVKVRGRVFIRKSEIDRIMVGAAV